MQNAKIENEINFLIYFKTVLCCNDSLDDIKQVLYAISSADKWKVTNKVRMPVLERENVIKRLLEPQMNEKV